MKPNFLIKFYIIYHLTKNVQIYIFESLGLGWRPGGFRGLQLRLQGTNNILGEFDSHTRPFNSIIYIYSFKNDLKESFFY